jgi:hypothetical protein
MMMGAKNGFQAQAGLSEKFFDRRGFSGINRRAQSAVTQNVNEIVFESREHMNF